MQGGVPCPDEQGPAWGWGRLFSFRGLPCLTQPSGATGPLTAHPGGLGAGSSGRAPPGLSPSSGRLRGEDLTSVWERPQLRGSLHPVGKGGPCSHAHLRTHTHTGTHMEAHRPALPGTCRLGAGGAGGPSSFGPWEVPFPMSLFAGPPPPPHWGSARSPPSWVWGPGHRPFLRFPCTDSHCPPAIPRHILFNNLSLLNYLLAFATSPPPPCPPLSPSALPTKAENGNNNNKKMRHQYICK